MFVQNCYVVQYTYVKIFVFVDVVNIVSIQYYIVYTVQCQHAMFLGCCIKVIYELNIKL